MPPIVVMGIIVVSNVNFVDVEVVVVVLIKIGLIVAIGPIVVPGMMVVGFVTSVVRVVRGQINTPLGRQLPK